jgi:hypothetical protein
MTSASGFTWVAREPRLIVGAKGARTRTETSRLPQPESLLPCQDPDNHRGFSVNLTAETGALAFRPLWQLYLFDVENPVWTQEMRRRGRGFARFCEPLPLWRVLVVQLAQRPVQLQLLLGQRGQLGKIAAALGLGNQRAQLALAAFDGPLLNLLKRALNL